MFQKWFAISKFELKYQTKFYFLSTLLIIMLSILLFGFNNIDTYTQQIIITRFLPLTVMFSLIQIFSVEQNTLTKDILKLSKTKFEIFYIFRYAFRIIVVSLILLLYLLTIKNSMTYSPFTSLLKINAIGLFSASFALIMYSISLNEVASFIIGSILLILFWFKNLRTLPYLKNIFLAFEKPLEQTIIIVLSFIVFYFTIIIFKNNNS